MRPHILPLLFTLASALDDGFGRTPVMGYNTYNDVACSPNSTWANETMLAMAAKGFVELGYRFFQIDCGWQATARQVNGSIDYNSTIFPEGIKPLSSQAISLGFEWSMYTDEGVLACDTVEPSPLPGSLGFEVQDALQFAGWNVDYVKVDNCYVNATEDAPKNPRHDFPWRYGRMSAALQSVGIKGMLVCQWGVPYINATGLYGPYAWAPALGTSYRVSDDIASGWANVLRILNEAIHVGLSGLSGPGRFADMDLLEVGNSGFTLAEQQTHFAIWAMFKSTLMISTNVPQMSDETYAILSNKNLIAINQDLLGEPVKLVQRFTNDHDLYSGNLSNGDIAVLAFDQSNTTRSLTIPLSALGIDTATILDLHTNTSTPLASSFTTTLSPHGSIALRLSSLAPAPPPSRQLQTYPFSTATLSGGAVLAPCAACATGLKAANISTAATATLALPGFRPRNATVDVYFAYINCEVGYLATGGTNARVARVSVKGGVGREVSFPLSGYDWSRDVLGGFRVRLEGWQTGEGAVNAISVTAEEGWAPDFDSVSVMV